MELLVQLPHLLKSMNVTYFSINIGCPQEDWAIATPQLSGKLPFQVKAPCNVLQISLHHDYESYSTDWTGQVESILASPGENPELHKIPEFTGRAVEAFQSSEVEFEKPRPASHEDSVLESSLDIKSSILTDSSNMFLAHACRRGQVQCQWRSVGAIGGSISSA